MEGTFRLDTPLFNFGYETSAELAVGARDEQAAALPRTDETVAGPASGWLACCDFFTASQEEAAEKSSLRLGRYMDARTEEEFQCFSCGTGASYITVMATLDPLLSSSPSVDGEVTRSSIFPPDLPFLSYYRHWAEALAARGDPVAKRSFNIFGTNSDGLSVLVSRYLKPHAPPAMCQNSRRSCLQLVSMLPFIPDSQSFAEFDLWCNNLQVRRTFFMLSSAAYV